MATGAENRLRMVRQLLQSIAKEAPQASASIKKVTETLDAMAARPAPKNIGFAFPKFTEVRRLADGFKEVDTKLGGANARLQAMARHAKIAVQEISQIQIQMARTGTAFEMQQLLPPAVRGPQAGLIAQLGLIDEDLAKAEVAQAKIIDMSDKAQRAAARSMAETFGAAPGMPAQIPITGDITALNQELLTSQNVTKAGGVALEELSKKYDAFGFKVQDAKAQIIANSKELEVHATIVKKVGKAYEVVGQAQTKVSLETLKPVKQIAPGAELEKLLGAQRFTQFNQQLKRLGLSMGDLKDSTIEGVNQISRFTFRSEQAGKATRTASFHFDRFGRSLGNMSNRFKSFDQAIAANIVKVMRWGIATMVVWGAVRQINEAFQQLVATQDLLTDLSITTGQSMDRMGVYFEKVAAVARETGTDINDAMKGINIAMRVGEGATQAEKISTSFDFLGDAAAYAKLSNLDMAKASDILIASLKQMGMAITEGDVLLNKWVATSRATNVSMVDLGQAFATTAASADAAGVSVDELNAYIATFALVTNKSAQEGAFIPPVLRRH
jgi:hypothetical protein